MADVSNAYESPSERAAARPRPWHSLRTGCLFVVLGLGGLLSAWIAALSCMMDQSYMSWPTAHNLRDVVLALREYHEDYGRFPPAVVTNANGQPLYSWRVLLLPYLPEGHDQRMPAFDLSQAWDSDVNRAASAYWRTSFDNPRRKGECVIYALVGQNTMFPHKGCRKLSDVTDDPAQTIILVSVFGRKQSWAAPGDVNIDTGPLVGREIQIPASDYWAGSQVGSLDGNAMRLPQSVTDDDLRAAASIAGGESIKLKK